LLHQAIQAFLPGDVSIADSRQQTDLTARQAMLAEYVAIQKAYARLKEALYRLMEAHIARGEWEQAYTVQHALAKVELDYRDSKLLEPGLELVRGIAEDLRQDRVSYALKRLAAYLNDSNLDPKLQLVVNQVVHDAVSHETWDGLIDVLRAVVYRRGINIRGWLEDHQVPFCEIRSQNLSWQDNNYQGGSAFITWLISQPTITILQNGIPVFGVGSLFSLSITFPSRGIFYKFSLPSMAPEAALGGGNNIVFGIVIYKP
jgi:hypothetical protein